MAAPAKTVSDHLWQRIIDFVKAQPGQSFSIHQVKRGLRLGGGTATYLGNSPDEWLKRGVSFTEIDKVRRVCYVPAQTPTAPTRHLTGARYLIAAHLKTKPDVFCDVADCCRTLGISSDLVPTLISDLKAWMDLGISMRLGPKMQDVALTATAQVAFQTNKLTTPSPEIQALLQRIRATPEVKLDGAPANWTIPVTVELTPEETTKLEMLSSLVGDPDLAQKLRTNLGEILAREARGHLDGLARDVITAMLRDKVAIIHVP